MSSTPAQLTTPASRTAPIAASIWSGRILSGLSILFLAFDGIGKLVKPAPVVDAFAQLGMPMSHSAGIGLLLLACTAVYAIPRSALQGAILLPGYLGGAIAIQVRAETGWFPVVFALIVAALVWGGLFLRDTRARVLLPWYA